MKGYTYWDKHDFKHEVRFTLRWLITKWTYSERSEMEAGYKLSAGYIEMDYGYRLNYYVERKKNGKILFCSLSYFKIGADDGVLHFEGNEKNANAWLAWLYDTYGTGPNFYSNDYWQDYTDDCLNEHDVGNCPEFTDPKFV